MRTRPVAIAAMTVGLFAAPTANPSVTREYVGEYRLTYYHVAVEDGRYDGEPRTELLRDPAGCELARVSARYRRALDREGTGRLADGRVINVAERTADGWRYVDPGPAHYGLGVGDVPLVPFRSVAADPRKLARGTRLYLPAFASWSLPDGTAHGGTFVVDDIGSAIRRNRLDIFIGDEAHPAPLEAVVPSHSRTPVYRLVRGSDGRVRDLLLEP